ncbi:MAG: hypothetical protein ISS31_01565 [Kiritimatiellae bacterium]|nr:hypothetical protein [Kiritimatiellia bacterium]
MALRTTALGTVAGLIIGIGLASFSPPADSPPPRAALVSDTHGRLAELCIHYRRDFHDHSVDLYTDFISALAPGTIVQVVTKDHSAFEFFRGAMVSALAMSGARLRPVITGFPITPWAKDRFGTMRTEDGEPLIAVPPAADHMTGPRGNDGRVPFVLAQRLSHAATRSLPFFFDGGDLIADDKIAYVAADFLARNQPEDVDNRVALINRIAFALGRHVVTLGRTPHDTPDHHIGMYLTPLGNRTVAVADPDLGRSILNRPPRTQRECGIDIETDESAYEPFRCVITEFEAKGFTVVRIPMLLTTTPRVYVTYNNAILETRDEDKRIYMPVYDLPRLDDAATRIFEAQGWNVIPVRVGKVYQHTGSLRCLVGIIRRG